MDAMDAVAGDTSVQILSGLNGLSAWRTLAVEDRPNRGVRMVPGGLVASLQGTYSGLGFGFDTITGFAERYKWYLIGAGVLGVGYYLYQSGRLPFGRHPTLAAAALRGQLMGLGRYGRPRRHYRGRRRRRHA